MTAPSKMAEELWEKHAGDGGLDGAHRRVDKSTFLAALREYGQFIGAAVRARDAVVCEGTAYPKEETIDGLDAVYNLACNNCAAAIAREPLP